MLKEIYCDKFKKKIIKFHNGLNVVLGDEIASNSIGKSTMLLAIDFAFGGSTYAKQENIIRNVGHHTLKFTFVFNNKKYYFSRSTNSENNVIVCNELWNKETEISKFTYFLVGSRIHEVSIYPILYMLSRSTADKPLSGNVKNKAHCQNKDVMLWTCFNSNRSLDRMWFYLFCTFMLSTVFLFSIGFCSAFLDIVHHVCKKQ
jgi:hypothetical protein